MTKGLQLDKAPGTLESVRDIFRTHGLSGLYIGFRLHFSPWFLFVARRWQKVLMRLPIAIQFATRSVQRYTFLSMTPCAIFLADNVQGSRVLRLPGCRYPFLSCPLRVVRLLVSLHGHRFTRLMCEYCLWNCDQSDRRRRLAGLRLKSNNVPYLACRPEVSG